MPTKTRVQQIPECNCQRRFLGEPSKGRQWKPYVDVRQSELYQALKYYIWAMRLTGSFYLHSCENPKAGEQTQDRFGRLPPPKKRTWGNSLEKFWMVFGTVSIFSQIITVPVFAIHMIKIARFELYTITMAMGIGWSTQNAVAIIMSMKLGWDPMRFNLLCHQWQRAVCCQVQLDKLVRSIRRQSIITICILFVGNSLNTCYWIITTSSTMGDFVPDEFKQYISPQLLLGSRLVWWSTHYFGSHAWSFPPLLFVIICTSLRDILRNYNDMVEKVLSQEGWDDGREIDPAPMIAIYQEIIEMVTTVSTMFGFYLLVTVCIDMFHTTANIYIMLSYPMPLVMQVTNLVWVATAFGILAIPSIISSDINLEAHKAYGYLSKLNLKKYGGTNMLKMSTKLLRLNGKTIGISLYGFLVLDKTTLGNLIGVYLSYFFFLYNFRDQRPPTEDLLTNATIANTTAEPWDL